MSTDIATKADLDRLENRLIKWFVASLFLSGGLVIAGVDVLMQALLSRIPT